MKWVRVVFTHPRVRNACRVLAAAAALGGDGGGREGGALITQSLFIWEPEWPVLQLLLNVLYRPIHPPSRRWGRNNKHTAHCQMCPSCRGPGLHLAFTEDLEMNDQEHAWPVPRELVRSTDSGARCRASNSTCLLLCDTQRQENPLNPQKNSPFFYDRWGN